MNELLIDLFKDELFLAIVNKAIESKQAVSLTSDVMKVNMIPNDNSFSIEIEYTPKSESADFKDYLQTLPDDVFIGVCELLGQDKVKQISNCLESDDIETVRSGILAFKNAIREYATLKYNFFKDLLK